MAIFSKKEKAAPAEEAANKEPESMQELYGAGSAKTAGATKSKAKLRSGSQAYRILLKPLITEKITHLGDLNKYAFAVDVAANKIEVAKAVEELYGVKPLQINIINLQGKRKQRGRVSGQRKDWKKALVTLPKGTKLDVYEGV